MILAITVLAEALGKAVLSHGLTTQIRPRKYYTVSKETLNSFIGDVHELINFFVIEAQQIVFAENLLASTAVCCSIPDRSDPANSCSRLSLLPSSPTTSLRLFHSGASLSWQPPSFSAYPWFIRLTKNSSTSSLRSSRSLLASRPSKSSHSPANTPLPSLRAQSTWLETTLPRHKKWLVTLADAPFLQHCQRLRQPRPRLQHTRPRTSQTHQRKGSSLHQLQMRWPPRATSLWSHHKQVKFWTNHYAMNFLEET